MRNIPTFDLHRSRIPTPLFKSIVQSIDIMLVQYGPVVEHYTEEATSQFLSPIFNHLISMFGSTFRNRPKSTRGRVKYHFQAFGPTTVLFIEFQLQGRGALERLDATAQVIAECYACNWENTQWDYPVPVHCILFDGDKFEFYLFDGSTKPPSFYRGHDPQTRLQKFPLPEVVTSRSFIHALHPICEIIFDFLLRGYTSSLKAYHDSLVNESAKNGRPVQDLDKWEQAITSAFEVLGKFRSAEMKRRDQLVDEANTIVGQAMEHLQHSIDEVPDINIRRLDSLENG